jgi:hypothetical protein
MLGLVQVTMSSSHAMHFKLVAGRGLSTDSEICTLDLENQTNVPKLNNRLIHHALTYWSQTLHYITCSTSLLQDTFIIG